MTHSLYAFNLVTKKTVVRPVEGFTASFDPAYEGKDWVQGICLAGQEADAINDAVWLANNPQPEPAEDEYEPEYSLAGGWAAWDAR